MKTLLVLLKLGPLSSILLNQQIIPYLQRSMSWAKLNNENDVWLIKTFETPSQVRDNIAQQLGSLGTTADKVIVLDVSRSEWASYNLPIEISNWIKNNIY